MNYKKAWLELSIKSRWAILVIGMFAMLAIAYKFNIQKTISLIGQYKEIENEIGVYATNRTKDAIVQNINETSFKSNDDLLKGIADYTEYSNISIQEISRYDIYISEGVNIETNKLVIKGNYTEIIDFVHYLEYVRKIAAINSLSVEMTYDKLIDEYTLIATLYIKCILYESTNK